MTDSLDQGTPTDPSQFGGNMTFGDPEADALYAAKGESQVLDTSLEGLTAYFNDKENNALPEPDMLRAASEVLGGYFSRVAESGEYDPDFADNVDSVVSAATGLVGERYDKLPNRNETDSKLIRGLFSRAMVDAVAASEEEGSKMIEQPSGAEDIHDLRVYVRAAERNPATYERLARVGADCSAILGLAADSIRTTTQLDKVLTGFVDKETKVYGSEMRFSNAVFKDYVHMHVGGILARISGSASHGTTKAISPPTTPKPEEQ